MNILITCLQYGRQTGSELYVYELQRELTKRGHKVLISAVNLWDGWLLDHTQATVCQTGQEPEFKPDVVHCNQRETLEVVLKTNTTLPIVCTVHSEIIEHERPIDDKRVRYIAVRQSIVDYCKQLGIKATLIPNPIDFDRFKLPPVSNGAILFAGTYYNLRDKAVRDVLRTATGKVYCVGENFEYLAPEFLDRRFYFFPPRPDIETILKHCEFTAGINFGRTALEGFVSGRKNLNYWVDDNGKILSKEWLDPPSDIDRYESSLVVGEILKLYENQR